MFPPHRRVRAFAALATAAALITQTAKVVNANGPRVVLDGGGLVTLSGGDARRILYMNTCDQAQGWTSRTSPSPTVTPPARPSTAAVVARSSSGAAR